MNNWKCATVLAICCCIIVTIAPSASADFVGVTTAKDDPNTQFNCIEGNGPYLPGPLTVCNVYAAFDDPADRLLSVGNADLQVYNGANPDVFYQHPLNPIAIAPTCASVGLFPELICDSFVTIGHKCGPDPPGIDGTTTSGDFDAGEFIFNGHLLGCWFNGVPPNGQGDAGNYPDLQVLFLQSSVAQGLSLSGDIDIFWNESPPEGETFAEVDVPIECVATCGSCPTDVDGDGLTNAFDLATLLGSWGPVDAGECLDNDTSGSIDAFDLAVLLGNWGPCP